MRTEPKWTPDAAGVGIREEGWIKANRREFEAATIRQKIPPALATLYIPLAR